MPQLLLELSHEILLLLMLVLATWRDYILKINIVKFGAGW